MLASKIPSRSGDSKKTPKGADVGGVPDQQQWMQAAWQAAVGCLQACGQTVPSERMPKPCDLQPAPLGFQGTANVAANGTDSFQVRVPFRNWTAMGLRISDALSQAWRINYITAELEPVIAAGQGPVPASSFSTSVQFPMALKFPYMSAGQNLYINATNVSNAASTLAGTFDGVQW